MQRLDMTLPIRMDLRVGHALRFGGNYCMVCGRKLNPKWWAKLRNWWHHRKCPPFVIHDVRHTWNAPRCYATTHILAVTEARRTWWDRLVRWRRFNPKVQPMAYSIEESRCE